MPYYQMPDNEKIYVREFGQGEPILVLSGLGMHSWQWLPFLYAFKKNYRFIIPDWRGFGKSSNCAFPKNIDAITSHWNDLEFLISKLELEKFKLIAYSMGATTAMHGMQYGDLSKHITSYLHIDQSPKILVDQNWKFGLFGDNHNQFKQLLEKLSTFLHSHKTYSYVDSLNDEKRNHLVSMWLEFIELQSSNKISPFLFKLALKRPNLQKYILPIHRLDYLTWYIDNYLYHTEDYRETLSNLNCPTTFFTGLQSSLYASQGQTLVAKSLKQSKQIVFEKSGHTPLISEPIKFTREIKKFLKNSTF